MSRGQIETGFSHRPINEFRLQCRSHVDQFDRLAADRRKPVDTVAGSEAERATTKSFAFEAAEGSID
jgi:hypothetical protein